MDIVEPLKRSKTPYFTVLVRRHEPGGQTKSRCVTLRPKTPQQEAMTAGDILADVLAFMEEKRW
jgi:hypothetical protein